MTWLDRHNILKQAKALRAQAAEFRLYAVTRERGTAKAWERSQALLAEAEKLEEGARV